MSSLDDSTIGSFIKTFKVDLEKIKCCKCDNKALFITNGILCESYPTINSWCRECFLKGDFDAMVTSQVRPSEHMVYNIETGKEGDVEKMRPQLDVHMPPGNIVIQSDRSPVLGNKYAADPCNIYSIVDNGRVIATYNKMRPLVFIDNQLISHQGDKLIKIDCVSQRCETIFDGLKVNSDNLMVKSINHSDYGVCIIYGNWLIAIIGDTIIYKKVSYNILNACIY